MRSQVCVDASLVLKLVLSESDSEQAHALWQRWVEGDVDVLAPDHLAVEATSVIRNHVHSRLISAEAGRQAFDALHAQSITLVPSTDLNLRAWQLAELFDRPTAYDTYYLALAEALDCDLWTADRRLVRAVEAMVDWVKWLGDVS
jgi:predicted nucleic acid-binding protein